MAVQVKERSRELDVITERIAALEEQVRLYLEECELCPTEEDSTERPRDWPELPSGFQNYLAVDTGKFWTGFPVQAVDGNTIAVSRFPLPAAKAFRLPALRYLRSENH